MNENPEKLELPDELVEYPLNLMMYDVVIFHSLPEECGHFQQAGRLLLHLRNTTVTCQDTRTLDWRHLPFDFFFLCKTLTSLPFSETNRSLNLFTTLLSYAKHGRHIQ